MAKRGYNVIPGESSLSASGKEACSTLATSFHVIWLVLGLNQEFFCVLLFLKELSPSGVAGKAILP